MGISVKMISFVLSATFLIIYDANSYYLDSYPYNEYPEEVNTYVKRGSGYSPEKRIRNTKPVDELIEMIEGGKNNYRPNMTHINKAMHLSDGIRRYQNDYPYNIYFDAKIPFMKRDSSDDAKMTFIDLPPATTSTRPTKSTTETIMYDPDMNLVNDGSQTKRSNAKLPLALEVQPVDYFDPRLKDLLLHMESATPEGMKINKNDLRVHENCLCFT